MCELNALVTLSEHTLKRDQGMSIQISLSLFFATLTRKAAIRHIIFRGHTSLRGSYLLNTYSFAGQVA